MSLAHNDPPEEPEPSRLYVCSGCFAFGDEPCVDGCPDAAERDCGEYREADADGRQPGPTHGDDEDIQW